MKDRAYSKWRSNQKAKAQAKAKAKPKNQVHELIDDSGIDAASEDEREYESDSSAVLIPQINPCDSPGWQWAFP